MTIEFIMDVPKDFVVKEKKMSINFYKLNVSYLMSEIGEIPDYINRNERKFIRCKFLNKKDALNMASCAFTGNSFTKEDIDVEVIEEIVFNQLK